MAVLGVHCTLYRLSQQELGDLRSFFQEFASDRFGPGNRGHCSSLLIRFSLTSCTVRLWKKDLKARRDHKIGADSPRWGPSENAHKEFSEVTVMPRSGWEPWDCFASHAKEEFKTTCVGENWRIARISVDTPFTGCHFVVSTRREDA